MEFSTWRAAAAFGARRAGIGLAAGAGGFTNAAMSAAAAVDFFPALDALPGVRAAFLTRPPGIDVAVDREEALARLRPAHESLTAQLGFEPPVLAEQVHGNLVTIVDGPLPSPASAADGLATATPGVTLGIYVADCAAIFLADPRRRAIALVHSGRKGTEADIFGQAVTTLRDHFGTEPADLVAVVSPCIRPPHYEIDFAATIAAQARAAGIGAFHDAGTCTASHPDRYYSYRREQGKTGRMLALLMVQP
jgi:copper oxidase (laccase) domain-containing protein